MKRTIVPLIAVAVALPAPLPAQQPPQLAHRATVTVTPEETDEILANPGMGWQTFHRTAKEDKNLPDWIPSTVHYARWGWGTLEPKPGQIDAAFLDKVLADTRAAGQQLAFRVMCCSTTPGRPYHPAWIKEAGARELAADYGKTAGLRVPDLDDPEVLRRHIDFIQRLGRRYDGHADIDHVDLGSVGWWGEWHMSDSNVKMPSPENRKKIVDAWLDAFPNTPVLMLIGGREMLVHAVGRGAGWRADCLGDLGGFSRTWCHMRKGYPVWVREARIEDAWKTAPVAWETCWDMRKWVDEGWPLRFIFNYALALHGSYINNKSAPLPEGKDVRPEVERFLRRLGYRLVLKELSHTAKAKAGEEIAFSMKWQNTGSAPCYRPYRLAYRLTGPGAYRKVLASPITVNRWLPGTIELFDEAFFQAPADLPPGPVAAVSDTLRLPADAPAGALELAVGIVGEKTEAPVVRLGIRGRDAQGWYPVGRIEVAK